MQNLISNPTNIALIVIAIVVIALGINVLSLHFKLKKFLIGKDSRNIEDSFVNIFKHMDEVKSFRNELEIYLTSVEKRLKKSVQSVHTVRFNPFKGTGAGGDQSFATAFLDENGNGVVISSIYSREHVSIYGKPIHKFDSEHELSAEEKESIETAKNKL